MKVTVTKIKDRWHAQLYSTIWAGVTYREPVVVDEMACENRQDIGYICREMMRWHSKLGSIDPHADAARTRHNLDTKPVGRIWYLRPETPLKK